MAVDDERKVPVVASATKNDPASFHDNVELFKRRDEITEQLDSLDQSDGSRETRAQARKLQRDLDTVLASLLDANSGLAHNYLRQFTGIGNRSDAEDYESAAMEGLLQAILSYQVDVGASFGWWAHRFVKRAVLIEVKKCDYPTLSNADFDKRPLILSIAERMQAPNGSVDPQQVAEVAEVPLAMVKRVLGPAKLTSLDNPLETESGAESLSAVIPDVSTNVEAEVLRRADLEMLTRRMQQLNDSELFILVRRYGLDGEPPIRVTDLSRMVGMSRSRCRSMLEASMVKLSNDMVRPSAVA